MKGLYTNRNSLSDFVRNGINHYLHNTTDAYLAVAFFTESDIVQEMLNQDCHVRLIVRLGFPTSPNALKKLLNKKNIEIRFFTGNSFHPKLYIFDDQKALVGSANLTTAALTTNQEVMVTLDGDDARLRELAILFADYWESANVLTTDELEKYELIHAEYRGATRSLYKLEDKIIEKIGKVTYANINRGKVKKTKENIFLDTYRKIYQESVTAFNQITEVYKATGRRKVPGANIPLRLEIDSFISYVRDKHATGGEWEQPPIGWNNDRQETLHLHIATWMNTPWHHFDETIIHENYPLIVTVFDSPQSIASATPEELVDALAVLHSFHDRLRFFGGGLPTLKANFLNINDYERIQASITHLLFGKGDIVKRMCDLLYGSSFELNEFGKSNVQELVGWMNKEQLPVMNGRTTKILRYYGFDVKQL